MMDKLEAALYTSKSLEQKVMDFRDQTGEVEHSAGRLMTATAPKVTTSSGSNRETMEPIQSTSTGATVPAVDANQRKGGHKGSVCSEINGQDNTETDTDNKDGQLEKSPFSYLMDGLSDEILLEIFKYLPLDGLINLSETCHRMKKLLTDKDLSTSLHFHWFYSTSRNSLERFLKDRIRSSFITSLNLTDMYWIPSGVLKDMVLGLDNLSEFLVAGTSLSWNHLKQILASRSTIIKLSWTWDHGLEESTRKTVQVSDTSSVRPAEGVHVQRNRIDERYIQVKDFSELYEFQDCFSRLKCLLIHVPTPLASKSSTDLLFTSFSALTVLISLCKNLEQLWLFSWPMTIVERKCSSSFTRTDSSSRTVLDLPKLHTVVLSVKDPPRLTTPRLILQLVTCLKTNQSQPKVLLLDHPLICIAQGIQAHLIRGNEGYGFNNDAQLRLGESGCWPQDVNLNQIKRFCYPLRFHSFREDFPNLPNLTHLHVTHGAPVVCSLSSVLDSINSLESFCCSTFNLRMDWKKFAAKHTKLKEISLCESETTDNYVVPLSNLNSLEKISFPLECLLEIKDKEAVADYKLEMLHREQVSSSADSTNRDDQASNIPTTSVRTYREYNTIPLKRRRVGLKVKSDLNSVDHVSGIDLFTVGCPKIEEVEIGLGERSKIFKAGRNLPDSLLSLCRWTLLKKLSLNDISITSGKFLIEVFKSCKLLESVRLRCLGNTAVCLYYKDLCLALPFCTNLKDFRFAQTNMGNPDLLLEALGKCPHLTRVLIWSSPNNIPLVPISVHRLFDGCKKLMVFYAAIDGTTKLVCKALEKSLKTTYLAERPALSVVIRNMDESECMINYPSVHYRQMVVFSPQVCQFAEFPSFNSFD